MEYILAAMRWPFPALTRMILGLELEGEIMAIVPTSFLGGSAPGRRVCMYSG